MTLADFTPESPTRFQVLLERIFGRWRVSHVLWSIGLIGAMVMTFSVGAVWQMERARSEREFTEEVSRLSQHVLEAATLQRSVMRQAVSLAKAISGDLPSRPVLWRQVGVAWVPKPSWSPTALAEVLSLSVPDAQLVMACLQRRAASTAWGGLCSVPQADGTQRIYLAERSGGRLRAWVLSRLPDTTLEEGLQHVPQHWHLSASLTTLSDERHIWPPKVKNGEWQATLAVFQTEVDLVLRVSAQERPLTGLDWLNRHAGVWVAVASSLLFTLAAMQGYLMLISARRRARGETKRIDAQLQRVRTRSYNVMDTAADAIIMADAQGVVTWCNKATTSIFGRTLEDLSGHAVASILPVLSQVGLDAWFDQYGVSGRVIGVDTEGQRAEGTAFPVALSASCTDIDGERIYIFIVRDSTDAKWAEQELSLRNHALESSKDGVVIVSMTWPYQPVIYANQGFVGLTGYEVHEILGQNLRVLHKHDTDQPGLRQLRTAIRQGEHCQVVLRNYTKSGALYYSEVSVSPVLNAEGVLTHYIGIQSDISERVAAEQVLQLRAERLNAVFELSPDGFVVLDRNGEIAIVNPSFERMTGMRAADLVGQSQDVLEAQLMGLCNSVDVEEAPSANELGEVSSRMTRRDLLHLHTPCTRVLARRIRQGAQHNEVVMYFRDVTHQFEVDRMKSEFLAMAAHELRTPMVSIFGFTELLLKRPFGPEQQKDMLTTIHRQSSLLINLINELLDLARIESRRGKDFHRERQALQPIIQQVLDSLLIQNDARKVSQVLPTAPIWVAVDRAKLSLVLTNVLSNAYKYSPGGGEIALDIVWRAGRAGDECGIRVQDHGLGMSEQQVAQVFDRFFRADTSGKIPGTGLGMTIVKEIIELHGGAVEVSSVLGVGTTVTLWLPVNSAQGPRDTSYDEAALFV